MRDKIFFMFSFSVLHRWEAVTKISCWKMMENFFDESFQLNCLSFSFSIFSFPYAMNNKWVLCQCICKYNKKRVCLLRIMSSFVSNIWIEKCYDSKLIDQPAMFPNQKCSLSCVLMGGAGKCFEEGLRKSAKITLVFFQLIKVDNHSTYRCICRRVPFNWLP